MSDKNEQREDPPQPEMMAGKNGGRLKRGGNPRKKGQISLTSLLLKKLREQAPTKKGGDPRKWSDAAVEGLILQAIAGNTQAIKELWGRVDGPLVTKSELTGADGEPLIPQANKFGLTDEELEKAINGETEP